VPGNVGSAAGAGSAADKSPPDGGTAPPGEAVPVGWVPGEAVLKEPEPAGAVERDEAAAPDVGPAVGWVSGPLAGTTLLQAASAVMPDSSAANGRTLLLRLYAQATVSRYGKGRSLSQA